MQYTNTNCFSRQKKLCDFYHFNDNLLLFLFVEYILKPGKVHFKKPKGHKTVFSDVWAGTYDTFVQLKETGEIYGWGLNNYYQLGTEDLLLLNLRL